MSKVNHPHAASVRRHAWRALLCALALLTLAAPALAAAQPITGTFAGKGVGREVSFTQRGEQRNNWAGVLRLDLDDGPTIPIFCIEIDVRVTDGDRYKSDGPVLGLRNGCQIRYLLDKYPASSARTADEAAARQMAIWVFSDGVDPAQIEDDTVRERTIALVNEAKKGDCPDRRADAPDLTIEPSAASVAPGQAIAYTVRAGAADAGQTVTLAVTGPAVIADAQKQPLGQQLQVPLDAQGNFSFWVISSAAGQTSVSVALPYRLEAGVVFSPIDDSRKTQRLVLAQSQNLTARASARGAWAGEAPPPTEQPPTQPPTTQQPAPPQPPRQDRPPQPPPQETLATAISNVVSSAAEQAEQSPPAQPTPVATQPAPQPPAAAPQPAGAAPQPAGGVVRPRSLPNTAEPAAPNTALLALVLLLFVGGWILRRAAPRR